MIEIWGESDFVGESGHHEPARRLQTVPRPTLIPLRKRALNDQPIDGDSDESGCEDNPMRGMASMQYICSRKYNSRRLDIEVMVDSGASYNIT